MSEQRNEYLSVHSHLHSHECSKKQPDPTVIRMLQDITGVDPLTIPMDDKETMSIFSSTEALEVTSEQINSKVGTFGIPEFGTKFVRGMLLDTRPKAFADLICRFGLPMVRMCGWEMPRI